MGAAERLYTPELLGLAVELVRFPPLHQPTVHAEARSSTCGSTVAIDLEISAQQQIEQLGMRVHACAVGQAAAAIFAKQAVGLDQASIAETLAQLESWLGNRGEPPDWPGLEAIFPARDFPGRHGAIMLPWKAAMAALSTAPSAV
jgi:NifU-like protein involved in Fe-S cluster formation